jgi:hypothetical protein
MKENEVGGACGTHGRVKCTEFWLKSSTERDHSENRDVDGRIGSEWILGRLGGGRGVEWFQLVQDRDRWRALVNTVTKFPV